MGRTTIKAEELLAIVNNTFEQLDSCRNLQVSAIDLDQDRPFGGNWITKGLRRSGYDHDQVACEEEVAKHLADLQARFDILD